MNKIINQDLASIYNGYAADKAKYWDDPYLIQIFDINCTRNFPEPFQGLVKQSSRYTFEFLDVDSPKDTSNDPELFEAFSMNADQAGIISKILAKAQKEKRDVIVHCTAGVCRSGAVVQFAIDHFGFDDPEIYRAPNTHVMKKLRESIGIFKSDSYYEDAFKYLD